jgi:hypothetical protein
MRYFYDPDVPWYMTRGIATNLSRLHQEKCIELLECLIESGVEPDYLQVFRFSYDDESKVITIRHTQEQPGYEKVIKYEIGDDTEPFTDKVFIIDDGDHRTILLASEY